MSPSRLDALGDARLRVRGGEREFTLSPGATSADLDALLVEHGKETFVFLPLFAPKRNKKKRRTSLARRLEKQRDKLGEGEWSEGEFEPYGDGGEVIPAAYAFDLRRVEARDLAEELGLACFYWGCRGAKLEMHPVEPDPEDEAFDAASMRTISREGRHDLFRTVLDLGRLRESTEEVGSSMTELLSVAASVVGISLAVCALFASGIVPDVSEDGWGWALLLVHPAILPPLILGLYMRRHLRPRRAGEAGGSRRELTSDETSSAWQRSAPHLLVVWGVVLAGVTLLSLARLLLRNEPGIVALVDAVTTFGLVALWILMPLTYARDLASSIGSCFGAVITVVVAIFAIKLALLFTNMATKLFWGLIASLFSRVIPPWVEEPLGAVVEIGAELFLFVIVLGYTWVKTREQFGRWANVAPLPRRSAV